MAKGSDARDDDLTAVRDDERVRRAGIADLVDRHDEVRQRRDVERVLDGRARRVRPRVTEVVRLDVRRVERSEVGGRLRGPRCGRESDGHALRRRVAVLQRVLVVMRGLVRGQDEVVQGVAGDVGGDGLLDEKKIPQLNLDADMVVLSACDTGSHGDNSGGEALGGLVSTFVQAGARNVVVSNWEVDTRASMRLMQEMFARKSASQADALAGAERSMMSSPDQYSHPYFWAPFTVVGDGARPMPAV